MRDRAADCAKATHLSPVSPVRIDSLAQPELIDQWCREKGMLAFGLRGPDAMVTVMGVLVKPVVPFAALSV